MEGSGNRRRKKPSAGRSLNKTVYDNICHEGRQTLSKLCESFKESSTVPSLSPSEQAAVDVLLKVSEDELKAILSAASRPTKSRSKIRVPGRDKPLSSREVTLLNTNKTKSEADIIRQLRKEFSLDLLSGALKRNTFVARFAVEALKYWPAVPLEQLSFDNVYEQFVHLSKTRVQHTPMQKEIYTHLRSDGPCAVLAVAPTGSGKTTALAATCSTNPSSIVVILPLTRRAAQEMVGVMSGRQDPVPNCVVRQNIETLKLEWVPTWEVMGRIPASQEKPALLKDMVDQLEVLRADPSASVKQTMPSVVIVDPTLRGDIKLGNIIRQIDKFASTHKLKQMFVIDDLYALGTESPGVIQLLISRPRIMALTATPPSDFGSPERQVNIARCRNGLEPFRVVQDSRTLGQGVQLLYKAPSGPQPFCLLEHDFEAFSRSTWALPTLSLSMSFSLLRETMGDLGARNFFLERYPRITLDDVREKVLELIGKYSPEEMTELVSRLSAKEVISQSSRANQILVTDCDPLDRAIEEQGKPVLEVIASNGSEAPWLEDMEKQFKTFQEAQKKQKSLEANFARSKRSGDQRSAYSASEFSHSHRVDSAEETVHFHYSKLSPLWSNQPILLERILGLVKEENISVIMASFLLQKEILIIANNTPQSWISEVLSHVHLIYGDIFVMGIGVHLESLGEVVLPRQEEPGDVPAAVLIQAMGRVGRPRQGVGHVVGTLGQFGEIFSGEFGESLKTTLDVLTRQVVKEGDVFQEEDESDEEEVTSAVSGAKQSASDLPSTSTEAGGDKQLPSVQVVEEEEEPTEEVPDDWENLLDM